jgi:hypothetical protein
MVLMIVHGDVIGYDGKTGTQEKLLFFAIFLKKHLDIHVYNLIT